MIVKVNEENLLSAAQIHAESWRDSHRTFCSKAFVEQHTIARQKTYLEQEMQEWFSHDGKTASAFGGAGRLYQMAFIVLKLCGTDGGVE